MFYSHFYLGSSYWPEPFWLNLRNSPVFWCYISGSPSIILGVNLKMSISSRSLNTTLWRLEVLIFLGLFILKSNLAYIPVLSTHLIPSSWRQLFSVLTFFSIVLKLNYWEWTSEVFLMLSALWKRNKWNNAYVKKCMCVCVWPKS